MSNIVKKIKEIPHWCYTKLPNPIQDAMQGLRRFKVNGKKHPDKQILILFVDGTRFHGGLCDRLKGAVSLFHYCLCNNIIFKISHTYPFNLSDFLVPNEYDWQINKDDISYHLCESKYLNIIANKDPYAKRLTGLNTKRQIHCFYNRDIVAGLNTIYGTNYQWGQLYKQLFRPTDELTEQIRMYQSKIGKTYICAQFRFQKLLGDFDEIYSRVLQIADKEILLRKCVQSVIELQEREDCKRIFVTSDSQTFLTEVSKLPNVCAFPSKTVHIDNAKGEAHDVYMKPFVDFYLLSEGIKVFGMGTRDMYPSQFPVCAALLNNVPFERIIIE